jgi:hypothetical protein
VHKTVPLSAPPKPPDSYPTKFKIQLHLILCSVRFALFIEAKPYFLPAAISLSKENHTPDPSWVVVPYRAGQLEVEFVGSRRRFAIEAQPHDIIVETQEDSSAVANCFMPESPCLSCAAVIRTFNAACTVGHDVAVLQTGDGRANPPDIDVVRHAPDAKALPP